MSPVCDHSVFLIIKKTNMCQHISWTCVLSLGWMNYLYGDQDLLSNIRHCRRWGLISIKSDISALCYSVFIIYYLNPESSHETLLRVMHLYMLNLIHENVLSLLFIQHYTYTQNKEQSLTSHKHVCLQNRKIKCEKSKQNFNKWNHKKSKNVQVKPKSQEAHGEVSPEEENHTFQ